MHYEQDTFPAVLYNILALFLEVDEKQQGLWPQSCQFICYKVIVTSFNHPRTFPKEKAEVRKV